MPPVRGARAGLFEAVLVVLSVPVIFYGLGSYSLVALATTLTFGFATAAMLIPALSEFDIATGAAPSRED